MSMAIFSPKLPNIAPQSHAKTHLVSRPNYLPLRPTKKLQFHLLVTTDGASGVAATAPEETTVSSDRESLGSNGSATPAAEVAVAVAEPVAVESVNSFQDARWIGGTWDLKQFEKDGKTNWDAVIDAEVKRRKWMEDTPQSSNNDEPVIFDTSIIPWWAWMKRFHLPEAELLNGRAAMIGFFMAYFVDSLTGVGLVDQMGNFFCKTLLFVAVGGVLLIRKNEDLETIKRLVEETTFYDKQWQAAWQDETSESKKLDRRSSFTDKTGAHNGFNRFLVRHLLDVLTTQLLSCSWDVEDIPGSLQRKRSWTAVPSEFSVKLSSVARRAIHPKAFGIKMELSITRPDDWHLHLRDGELLEAVVPHSSQHFGRAIVMPNLRPPVTTTAAAMAYRQSIMKALPENSDFTPLMTLYLTDTTSPNEIKLARESGVVFAVKLYPAGATTNSQDGVTDLFGKCVPVLEEMVRQNMPLLVHGEVTNPDVDVFDREKVFIDTVLRPLIQKFPILKVVMEHITTKDAAEFVLSSDERFVAATVTPQRLVLNRNSLFHGGLQPHNYCLPVLKREIHRQAIVSAVTSGSTRFFLGTDSAPHERRKKESTCGCAGIYNSPVALSVYAKVFEEAGALDKLEAFTSFNGPDFYGLLRNSSKIRLSKNPWTVPASFSFGWGDIVPMFAGQTLDWLPSDL